MIFQQYPKTLFFCWQCFTVFSILPGHFWSGHQSQSSENHLSLSDSMYDLHSAYALARILKWYYLEDKIVSMSNWINLSIPYHYNKIHHQHLKGSQQYGDFALQAHVLPSNNYNENAWTMLDRLSVTEEVMSEWSRPKSECFLTVINEI